MKAVILVAGEGTRLEPLTYVRPKPMIPIANNPLLEHVIDAVVGAGITEIVLVVGYKRERIQNYFGDGDDWDVDIEYAIQEKQLGTGHAILQAEQFIDGEFLVLNGDRIIEASIVDRLIQTLDETDTPVMAATRSEQPSDYGVIEVSGDRVRDIAEKPPQHAAVSDIINAGVYGFQPTIFDEIRATEPTEKGEVAITTTLQRLIANNVVNVVQYRGLWLDVSFLWDIISVNAGVLNRHGTSIDKNARVHDHAILSDPVALSNGTVIQPNSTVLRGTSLGDNVTIGPNVVISNSVVFPDATIEAGAVLRDCVIGANAHIGPNTTIEGGRTNVISENTVHEAVKLGGVIGDNARLGGNVSVVPGTILGNNATVDGGVTLEGRFDVDVTVKRG